MKHIIILILLLCLFSLTYILIDDTKNEEKIDTVVYKSTYEEAHLEKTVIETQIINQNSDNNFTMSDTGVENTPDSLETKTITPFNEEDIDETKLIMETISGVEPISAIRINKELIKTVNIGDILVLPELDGVSYELEITHRTVSANGNISLNGTFSENGIPYHSIITEGGKSTLMSFSTPTGSYEVELLDGLGYIYLNADIENEKIDYTKSDVIEDIDTKRKEKR